MHSAFGHDSSPDREQEPILRERPRQVSAGLFPFVLAKFKLLSLPEICCCLDLDELSSSKVTVWDFSGKRSVQMQCQERSWAL